MSGIEVQSRKKKFREIYFITQGQVEMYDSSAVHFMNLPSGCIFGDYFVLFNLDSNIAFKVASNEENIPAKFMACDRKVVDELCALYPQTAENLKQRSLEKRAIYLHYMLKAS